MDLSILQGAISERNLPLKIGEPTPGLGNCFLEALKQNFHHFNSQGLIAEDHVPKDVTRMREEIIQFMLQQKSSFVGGLDDKGEFKPGPLTEESFAELISDQSRENAYTDLDGWFILYSCKLYKIELQILQTDISTPILSSGIGGPLVSINKPHEDEDYEKPIFYMGLIKNHSHQDGHYQFIYQSRSNSAESSTASFQVTSPVKLSRSRLVRNYLKTPSPKKRPSDSHCFCCKSKISTAAELETHLSSSARCKTMYLQTIRNKNLPAFLVSLNPCFFCPFTADKFYLSTHLKKNRQCLERYCSKYSVNSLKEVIKKIENMKKTMWESRSRAKRRIETKKLKEKKNKEDPKLTHTDLVNQFRRETSLTNVRHCYNCKSNLSESRAEEVKMENLPDNISEKLDCRRFQKWFICGQCRGNNEPTLNSPIMQNVKVKRLEISGKRVFVPQVQKSDAFGGEASVNEGMNIEDNMSICEDASPSQVQICPERKENPSMEKCLFPCNVQSLAFFTNSKVKPRFQDAQTMLYKVGPVSDNAFSLMYENELFKYYSAMTFGDKFKGEIKEGDSKLLTSAERLVMDGVIVGSDTSKNIERRNKIHRFEHFGSILCSFSVLIPVSPDIIASSKIQTGVVITLEFKAGGNGEFQTEYKVHDHASDTDCQENCQTRTLQSLLSNSNQSEVDNVLRNHLMTYLSNVQLKMNSFARNFLRNEASPLHAEDFTLEFEFQENGLIKLRGFIWPKMLEALNVSFASYPQKPIEKVVKERSIDYVDSLITASSDPTTLKVQFHLSEAESNQLSVLAGAQQVHLCKDCSKFTSPSLPSLQTIFIETPSLDDSLNIETATQFNKLFLSILKCTSEEEVKSKSTEEWLHTVFQYLHTEARVIGDDILRIKAMDSSFDFIIDERLKEMISHFQNYEIAAYHYSISCGEVSTSFGCVIKRPKLVDCYTQPYNIWLLKAFNAPMELMVVNGHNEVQRMNLKEINMELDLGENEELKLSHNLINITEAATLYDKHLSRSNRSTTIEFVNTVKERKYYFKKVAIENDATFKCEISGEIFERTLSNIDRYFGRQNGKCLTLMEFASHYDYCGQEESRQLLKIFVNPSTDIQSSNIRSASYEEEYLPEFIVSNSVDVMKLRNSRKVVSYPCYDDNPSKLTYAKVLLFYPHNATSLDEKDVISMSQELDEAGSLIVERNER